MGYDVGFDMIPSLTKDFVDGYNWNEFMERIKHHFKGDARIERKSNYILFRAGEHTMQPYESFKVLRFGGKTTDSTARTKGFERYSDTVTPVAKECFGAYVLYRSESLDNMMNATGLKSTIHSSCTNKLSIPR
jgi:hypothetical protein